MKLLRSLVLLKHSHELRTVLRLDSFIQLIITGIVHLFIVNVLVCDNSVVSIGEKLAVLDRVWWHGASLSE